MKTLIAVSALTAILATSSVAKTERAKAVRVQPNNSVTQVNNAFCHFHHAHPILIPEFDSSFCATAEATNSPHQTDAGTMPGCWSLVAAASAVAGRGFPVARFGREGPCRAVSSKKPVNRCNLDGSVGRGARGTAVAPSPRPFPDPPRSRRLQGREFRVLRLVTLQIG
jgi:hypothetical protein